MPAYHDHLQALLTRHARDHAALNAVIDRTRKPFSLIGLINAGLKRPEIDPWKIDLDGTRAVQAAIAEQTENHPDGAYVPLSILAEKRDLVSSGASALVGSHPKTLIDALRPASALLGVGATLVPGVQGGAFPLPRVTTAPRAGVVAEGDPAQENDPVFGLGSVEPHTVTVVLDLSRSWIKSTTPAMEARIRQMLLEAIMAEVDRLAIAGTGADEPRGLLHTEGVTLVAAGTNGAAPTWDLITGMEYEVETATDPAAGAWLTNAAVKRKLRRTQRAAGLDFIMPGRDLLGSPLRTSGHVPANLDKGTSTGVCSALVHGDFARVLIPIWGPAAVDLLVDGFTRAKYGEVRLVARMEIGVGVDQPGAFAVCRDLLTA